MNIRLILAVLLLVSNLAVSQELHIKGVYTGSNVYVMNPFTKTDNKFAINSISINDKNYPEDIKSSAFEIDLQQMGFKLGDELHFYIKYKDATAPSIINIEAIQAISAFKIEKAFVDKQQYLRWQCSGEIGSLPFYIQQYRWNKWITIGQLRGVGTSGINHYKIKIQVHSGDNIYRIHQIDNSEKPRYSEKIHYKSKIKPVYLVSNKVTEELKFTAPTQFEIFDLYGNIIFDGFSDQVRLDDLLRGKYYVNFDNTIGEFTKE